MGLRGVSRLALGLAILVIVLLGAGLWLALGRGGGAPAATTPTGAGTAATPTPATAAGQQVKLVVLARSGTYYDGLLIAAKEYTRKTGVEVEVIQLGYKELHDKIATEMLSGTGAYDVVMLDDPWMPEFASKGFLVDIGELMRAKGLTLDPDFINTTVEVAKYKGRLYGLPYVGNVQLFAYRKDLFTKYGLPAPKTWDDVVNAARVIQEGEGGTVYGFVTRGLKGNPVVTDYFLPIFWGVGGELLDRSGRPTVYTEQGLKALQIMLELKKYAPRGIESYDIGEVTSALYQGQAAMAIVWPAWIPDLMDPQKSRVAGKVEITVAPGGRAMSGVWLLGIPVTSKNKDLALDFILFTLSKDMQRRLALEAGVPPTRLSVYLDPEVSAKYPWYPVQAEALQKAVPRPRIPEWNQVVDVLANYVHQVLTGQLPPEDALKSAQAELERIIKPG